MAAPLRYNRPDATVLKEESQLAARRYCRHTLDGVAPELRRRFAEEHVTRMVTLGVYTREAWVPLWFALAWLVEGYADTALLALAARPDIHHVAYAVMDLGGVRAARAYLKARLADLWAAP